MIEDREIWACALQTMQRYGDAAWFHAAGQADELLAANDAQGHQTWLRILDRINQLERIEPEGGLQ